MTYFEGVVMSDGIRESDGLNKSARYRAKDVNAYRAKKAEFARSPEQRKKRTEYMRVWREENREKHNAQARASHARNKHKHVEKNKDRRLQTLFGITMLDKSSMVDAQGGCCLICKEQFTSARATHVDHCHKTGIVRGILCHRCNTKLGWFERYYLEISEYLDTVW